MGSPARILRGAHRTAATPKLLENARSRTQEGSCPFVSLVPRPYWDPDTEEAASAIELAMRLLEEPAGYPVEAVGEDPDPFVTARDALERSPFDEVIVSTLPLRVSHWLRLDLPDRIERLGVPVTVTASQSARARRP